MVLFFNIKVIKLVKVYPNTFLFHFPLCLNNIPFDYNFLTTQFPYKYILKQFSLNRKMYEVQQIIITLNTFIGAMTVVIHITIHKSVIKIYLKSNKILLSRMFLYKTFY